MKVYRVWYYVRTRTWTQAYKDIVAESMADAIRKSRVTRNLIAVELQEEV